MKAVCNNDSSHKRFITVIHATQDAIVDDKGEIIEFADTSEGEVVHGPNIGNTWTCEECGSKVIVEE